MPKKSNVPNISEVRQSIHYDLSPKKKPQSDELVLRGSYNQDVPVNRKSGYYQFRSGSTATTGKGYINFRVSNNPSDYPGNWTSRSQLETFVQGYIKHCYKFLHSCGWQDVNIQLVDTLTPLGSYDWNDPERSLRIECMASYLSPAKPKTKSLAYIDYGDKGY